jgi:hypothetical protein
VQIQDLQARFSATNQNDVNLALQSMTSSIETMQNTLQTMQTRVNNLQPAHGTTAQRPLGMGAGYQWFDDSIGRAIWWKGSSWVDATGATV